MIGENSTNSKYLDKKCTLSVGGALLKMGR